jgi:hypothetical protein
MSLAAEKLIEWEGYEQFAYHCTEVCPDSGHRAGYRERERALESASRRLNTS